MSSDEAANSPLEQQWPYEHVEPDEVTPDLSAHEVTVLREALEDLRSTIDDWACDDCGERKSVVWHPASDTDRCRVCAGFEDPAADSNTSTADQQTATSSTEPNREGDR